jgi:23S rRNA (uracil1939-C5)-methyltransferase
LRLLYQRLKETCSNLCGIALARSPEGGCFDQVGNPYVEMTIGGLRLRVGPTCFYQVGEEGAEKILRVVESWMEGERMERILDLYCGVGVFSLPLAGRARQVVGVESHPEAATLAQENIRRCRLSNATIIKAKVEKVLSRSLAGSRFDLVIADPPRSGLSREAVEGLGRLNSPRIIYISCDPSTLARDLGGLVEQGYRCRWVQPLDLFPQTYHIETAVLLERGAKE